MKQILLITLILLSANSFGQKTIEYKIDDNLTITLPDNYQVLDTLGQRMIKAPVDYGLILISKFPIQDKASISFTNNNGLVEFYNGIQEGVVKSSQGELISQEITDINKLKFIKFSYKAKMGGDIQIRDCLGVLLEENIYLFNFWQSESMVKEMKKQREVFFASLKINPQLTPNDQFINLPEESTSYNWGILMGKYLAYILIIGLPALLIVWIVNRKKK